MPSWKRGMSRGLSCSHVLGLRASQALLMRPRGFLRRPTIPLGRLAPPSPLLPWFQRPPTKQVAAFPPLSPVLPHNGRGGCPPFLSSALLRGVWVWWALRQLRNGQGTGPFEGVLASAMGDAVVRARPVAGTLSMPCPPSEGAPHLFLFPGCPRAGS